MPGRWLVVTDPEMNIDETKEDADFRGKVREWLVDNVPSRPQPQGGPEMREFDLAWQRAQHTGGWAGISWPAEYGGRGLSLREQLIWYEEYARAGAPDAGVCSVGLNHAGPTLIASASEELKSFHLPRILAGTLVWAQGFSEPGAGSDLAGVSTRGVLDSDRLVVTGHKIWSSFADYADYQELLVRTGTGPRPHDGLTWVICDMRLPGITVRPIPTMVGTAHFCEVFYDRVSIPLSNIVGAVNDGWRVAMGTLSFERGTGFMKEQVRLEREVDELVRLASQLKDARGRRLLDNDHLAHQLAMARAETQALRAMTIAAVSRSAGSAAPGPYGSMIRLYYSELHQRVARLALDIAAIDALEQRDLGQSGCWSAAYLTSFADTIAAGTKDIQRNIIGERLLGLPKGR
jgi:alkylation response protein AidB-like acyl-CoA dehydrogenase